MLTWLLVNTVLSLLALSFAQLNQGAPHRLRFYVCFVALLCWLVPWAQVPQLLPLQGLPQLLSLKLWRAEQQLIASSIDATQLPPIVIDTRNVPLADELTFLHLPLMLLAALFFIGAVLFGWNVLQHQLRLRSLKRTARDGAIYWQRSGIDSQVPLLLQNRVAGAFSSGVVTPVIWVHDDLINSRELPTLLRHELMHIQQHDNWYLLAITLVEKLLWWNPLAWYLGQQSRQLQELSCDERCRACDADYAADLAQLMLSNAGISRSLAPEPLLLSANIFNKPNLNIQRLKVLQRSHQMKPRHIASAIATAVLAITTVELVTAQPDTAVVPATTVDRQVFIVRTDGAAPAPGGDVMFNVAVPAPGEGPQMVMGMAGPGGDQMMHAETINGATAISMKFDDAPLPMVLGALARLLVAPPMPALPPGADIQTVELALEDGTPAPGARIVRRLHAEGGVAAKAAGEAHFEIPQPANLVVEDDSAKARKVSVELTNATLADALDEIATASGCNIFKDADTIVVDYCKAQ